MSEHINTARESHRRDKAGDDKDAKRISILFHTREPAIVAMIKLVDWSDEEREFLKRVGLITERKGQVNQ